MFSLVLEQIDYNHAQSKCEHILAVITAINYKLKVKKIPNQMNAIWDWQTNHRYKDNGAYIAQFQNVMIIALWINCK